MSGAFEHNPASPAADDETVVAQLLSEVAVNPSDPRPLTKLGKLFAQAGRLTEARVVFQRALSIDGRDLDALWGLSDVEQVLGDDAAALSAQYRAVGIQPVVAVNTAINRGAVAERPVRVLMLCVPGTFQANTPLEYIVDGAQIALHKWYLQPGTAMPELPEYDVVFTAIGHDLRALEAIDFAQQFVDAQSRPVINEPCLVPYLARDVLAERFADSKHVHVAPVERMPVTALATRDITRRVLVRPINSQAGDRLALLRTNAERDAYLEHNAAAGDVYMMPFVDYRSVDGYYRKYRIVFIDGEPYPVHLAISPRWMVHYYNASMTEFAWMRSEEEAFMRDIASVFSGKLGEGLREIGGALPFGYFAIDCGIAADGTFMLFEADTAMLVHMQDSQVLFPYKTRYVERIVDAINAMFMRRSEHHVAATSALRASDNDLELDEPVQMITGTHFAADSTVAAL